MAKKKPEKPPEELPIIASCDDGDCGPQGGMPSVEERLEDEGIFVISDVITGDSIKRTLLGLLEKNYIGWQREVQIFINSPGGLTAEGWSLVDIMKFVSFPVKTIAMGRICSMAAIITASGDKGSRFAFENTEIMIHQHSGFLEGQYNQLTANHEGQEQEYNRHINFWKTHSKYRKETEIVKNILKNSDNYMTAQQAMKHGIIDRIIKSNKWK